MTKRLLGLALMLLAAPALAGNFFEPPQGWGQEHSLSWLSYVLGPVFANVVTSGNISGEVSIAGEIAGIFNTAALLIGIVLMTYTYLAGSIKTANDGEFLGRKWSGWGIPLRTGLAIAVLLPTTAGYCVLQLFLFWSTGQGIGLANQAMDKGLQVVVKNRGLTEPIIPAGIQVNELMNIAMCSSIVEDTGNGVVVREAPIDSGLVTQLKNLWGYITQGSATVVNVSTATGGIVGYDYTVHGVSSGTGCGKIRWVRTSNTEYEAETGSTPPFWRPEGTTISEAPVAPFSMPSAAYEAFLTDVYGFSRGCVDYLMTGSGTPCASRTLKEIADTVLSAATGNVEEKAKLSNGGEYYRALERIQDEVNRAYKAQVLSSMETHVYNALKTDAPIPFFTAASPNGEAWLAAVIEEVQSAGWFGLGSIYARIAAVSDVTQGLVNNAVYFDVPATADWEITNVSYNSQALAAVTLYAAYMNSSAAQSGHGTPPTGAAARTVNDSGGSALNMLRSYSSRASENVMGALGIGTLGSDWTDPITELKSIGDRLIWAAEAGLATVGAAGVAATVNPAGKAASVITSGVGEMAVSAATAIFGALLGIGLFLAVVIPFTPMIVWIAGFVGWMILVIQAIFAAPIWAVAHLHPEGGEIVGKGSPGYMFVLALMIRPFLMVAFFFLAMVLVKPLIWALNYIFVYAFRAIQVGTFTGLMTMLAAAAIYAFIAFKVVYRCFAMVNEGPTYVMQWIGGSDAVGAQANSDGSEIVSAAKGGGTAVSGVAGGAAASAMRGGMMSRRYGSKADDQNQTVPKSNIQSGGMSDLVGTTVHLRARRDDMTPKQA